MTNFELLFKLKQSLIKNNQNEKISNWILMHVYDLDDYTDLMNILPLEATKNNECELILKEYLAGKPLSKIFGSTYFCCNKFIVDNNVFSPRVETELLIEYLSKYINKFNFISDIDFLDMCCGTGVIGISVKLKFKNNLNLTLVDINEDACVNSKKNLKLYNLKADVICSNLFSNLKKKFDIIACNPPYISFDEDIGFVEKYDPQNALFAEKNGYFIYEEIISNYSNYIKNNQKFLLAFEIGMGQEEKIKNMLLFWDPKIKVDIIKDYNNINRFIFAYKNYDI